MFGKLKKMQLAAELEMTQKHLDFEKKKFALEMARNIYSNSSSTDVVLYAKEFEQFLNGK